MTLVLPGAIIGGNSAQGVTFDGTNDYLSLASEPTGLADTAIGLLSVWIKAPPKAPTASYLVYTGSIRFRIDFDASDQVRIVGLNTAASVRLSMTSSIAVLDSSWHHILAAWDTATSANCKVYVDGVDRTTLATRVAGNIDYTFGSFYVGAITAGLSQLQGDVAEFWFDSNQWIDITNSSNRAKFANNGRPVSLASDGSKPTGTAPIIYFKGPASNWGTNAGTGGNFTANGAFTNATTKPSY